MEQWTGLIGIVAILTFAVLMSNNRHAINWRLVINGLLLQWVLALFILKVPIGQQIFHTVGQGIQQILSFSDQGASFVFGPLVSQPQKMIELFGPAGGFIFAFKLVPTIIFVSVLVSLSYHLGLMQRIVQVVAWAVSKLMGASGAEALSNAASIFVGQVEAQLLIKPYVPTMTQSELLAIMAGSMACIAGGVMAVYIQMGIPAEYLLTASLMAAPGALVISKLVCPETQFSLTQGEVKLKVKKTSVNLIDAAAHGASDGLKIGLNVCAMLIGFIALMGLIDFVLAKTGLLLAGWGFSLNSVGIDLTHLSLKTIFGSLFSVIAVALGVPFQDSRTIGSLMGTKLVLNEFVAYMDLAPMIQNHTLSPKSIAIVSFALCGFANFSSIAMQIGGIGELAPTRKADLAKLGLKALMCGTLASYLSSAIAGILISDPTGSETPLFIPLLLMAGAIVLMVVTHRFGWKQPSFQPNPYQSFPLAGPTFTESRKAEEKSPVSVS